MNKYRYKNQGSENQQQNQQNAQTLTNENTKNKVTPTFKEKTRATRELVEDEEAGQY